MTASFFFYDLETSGLSPRNDRIMQFAGQRTDLKLRPIGEPENFLVKMANDVLPSPEAIMVTKITPLQTLSDGLTEDETAKHLLANVFTPGTIAVGFNNVRFDDEFLRHLFWRNYQDPYAWASFDERGRWDLLDVVRLVRAIRPEGINWPVDEDGKPVNKLELLTKVNNLEHTKAHDALSDVEGLIAIARMIQQKQPKMWDYLLSIRHKKAVEKMVNLQTPQPFVYASGRYSKDHNATTVAYPITTSGRYLLVYDLRYDPTELVNKSAEELLAEMTPDYELEPDQRPPVKLYVKALRTNRCPAVAPLGVLNSDQVWQNIGLDLTTVKQNLAKLKQNPELINKFERVMELKQERLEQFLAEKSSAAPLPELAEAKLYDGFVNDLGDKSMMQEIRDASPARLATFNPDFKDQRLDDLWLGYKARSFEKQLSDSEHQAWDERRLAILQATGPDYLMKVEQMIQSDDEDQQFYGQELRLWLESIMPSDSF